MITIQALDSVAKRISELTKCDYTVECTSQGKRLVRNQESVNVSPILPSRDLFQWMLAFEEGIRIGRQQLFQELKEFANRL